MQKDKPAVAVVILSWNGKEFLRQFIPPLLKTTYANSKFYVADNASTDCTTDFILQNFPEVNVIKLDENSGFAEGYNRALKQVHADYYVLLNQDVEVTPNWIEPVIELMQRDENIAACQPKLRAFHDKQMFEYAGAAGGFIDRNGYAFCRGRFFDEIEKDEGQYDLESEIVWASGASMFVRAGLYHKLGGLDSDFFAHFEEIDLCWRIKNAGYKIMYCPHSVVYHVGGGSLPKGNPRKTLLNFRNNLSAMLKNLPQDQLYRVLALRYFLDIISALKFLFSGNWGDFKAVIKAHYHFFKNLKKLFKKRKETWQIIDRGKVGAPNLKGFYNASIIVDHFLKGKKKFSELSPENFL